VYNYRPAALGRFKLQYVPGYETVSGGAVRMDYTQQNGLLHFYVGFGEAGVVISNGRLFVADGGGGFVFLK
jgi:hypothetical protein